MRVGILGLGWGRTHIGTFRAAGAAVHAVVGPDPGRSRGVAEAEGVPHWEMAALADCDLVVIATPTPTHRDLVERFAASHWVLCEKPLFGVPPDDGLEALARSPRLHVGYAFPFLPTASAFLDTLDPRAGTHTLRVDVGLDRLDDPRAALIEVAVHPLAALLHRFGPFALAAPRLTANTLSGELVFAHATVGLEVRSGAPAGIAVAMASGDAELHAEYRPSVPWTCRLHRRGAVALAEGPPRDVWYEAHAALARTLVDRIEGRLDPAEAARAGLLTGAAAIGIERGLGAALGPWPRE
jgi:predicted dehydrogenase